MNNTWIAPHSWTSIFGWTIVWQSTLWLALGLLAGRVLRRHAARAHLFVLLTVAASVLSPLLTIAAHRFQWGLLSPSETTLSAAAALESLDRSMAVQELNNAGQRRGDMPAADFTRTSAKTAGASAPTKIAGHTFGWLVAVREMGPRVLMGAWVVCSSFFFGRLLASLFAGRRVVHHAQVETHAGLLTALDEAACALAIRKRPMLRASIAVRSPMIWCWGGEPVLLAPVLAPDQRSVNWRSVFCHELAHWLRRDHWASLCADLLVTAVPWQPLAWRVRRQLAELREQACDDWVLASGGDAADYAESLVNLVPQGIPAVGLNVLNSRESLAQRLEHLFSSAPVIPRAGGVQSIAAVFLALGAVGGIALAQQRSGRPAIAEQPTSANAALLVARRDAAPTSPVKGPVRHYSGKVVGPDGKPAASAQVFFTRAGADSHIDLKATTGESGVFGFSIPADEFFGAQWLRIVAVKPGFGPAWIDAAALKESSGIALRLASDDLPIEGRLLDLEGRPVVGATVRAAVLQAPESDDLQPYVKSLKTRSNYQFRRWLGEIPEMPAVRTDEAGIFRLTGVGRHRHVQLEIGGEGIADSRIEVLTDPFDAKAGGAGGDQDWSRPLYGPRFVHHLRPSRPIVGTVTNAQTARPVVGARVAQLDGRSHVTTDASGHFELKGCAKRDRYQLLASAPSDEFNFSGSALVLDKPGLEPLKVQLHVYPAIPLSGRVIDEVTGKPVAAEISYWPLYPNSHVVDGMNGTAIHAVSAFSRAFSKADGTFSLGVLAGPGALLVRIPRKDDFEPGHADAAAFFKVQGVRYGISNVQGQTVDHLCFCASANVFGFLRISDQQGIALLNVPENAQRLVHDLTVRSKAKREGTKP